jgi:hypothetical protein
MLPVFDVSERIMTFNPNILISTVRKLCHNKQNGNSTILGISMEQLLQNTHRISGRF